MITVAAYDPAWPGHFASLSSELPALLAGLPVRIEHVGSTSVPGLAAKPVLDVDIVTPAASVAAVLARLASAGYTPRGDLGIPGREAVASPADPAHRARHGGLQRNIYVCADGGLALRNHLAVRDTLRADAGLREQYARTKTRLAQLTDDIDTYVEGNSAVLQRILEAGGIGADERESVHDANRAPRTAPPPASSSAKLGGGTLKT